VRTQLRIHHWGFGLVVFAGVAAILALIVAIIHIKVRNNIDYYSTYRVKRMTYFFKYQPQNLTIDLNLDQ